MATFNPQKSNQSKQQNQQPVNVEKVEVQEEVQAIEPEVEVVPEVKQEAPVKVQETVNMTSKKGDIPLSELKQHFDVKDSVTMYSIHLLDKYVSDMAPGKMLEPNVIARNQYTLWTTYLNIIRKHEGDEFKNRWTLLIKYFKEYKNGALSEMYINRDSHLWQGSKEEYNGFVHLNHILLESASLKNKADIFKEVNMNVALSSVFTESDKNKIINYYS